MLIGAPLRICFGLILIDLSTSAGTLYGRGEGLKGGLLEELGPTCHTTTKQRRGELPPLPHILGNQEMEGDED